MGAFSEPAGSTRASNTGRIARLSIRPVLTSLAAACFVFPVLRTEAAGSDRADGPLGSTRPLPRVTTVMTPIRAEPEGFLRSTPAARAGIGCPGPVVASHTDAIFAGGTYNTQGGFAELEIAAVTFELNPNDFPLTLQSVEAVLAQRDTVVDTETAYTFYVWDGFPDTGIEIARFSSDGVTIAHAWIPRGTNGVNIQIQIDPSDPEQIFVFNDSGTNHLSIGFQIDHHNSPPSNQCLEPINVRLNAFPTTDLSGVSKPTGNWLFGLFCQGSPCSGFKSFADLSILCRPTGDWLIRATYLCSATNGA